MIFWLGTQERVRNSRGKRAISVGTLEVLLHNHASSHFPRYDCYVNNVNIWQKIYRQICLNIDIPKTIYFPFGTNVNFMVLDDPIFRQPRVVYFSGTKRKKMTDKISVSISPRNLYNSLNSIKENMFCIQFH